MVKLKCEICSDEIEKGFMNKIVGTVIRVKDGEKSDTQGVPHKAKLVKGKVVHVCPFCQKKYGDEVKGQI